METTLFTRISRHAVGALLLMAAATAISSTGCAPESNQAQKLEAPDNIDWAAIEAEDEAMAESQSVGE